MLITLLHDFPLIQDLFLNKRAHYILKNLAGSCYSPPNNFLCNFVLKNVLHLILFNHGQLQNGKYYLNGEVLHLSAIKSLFHDFCLSERSFLKYIILFRKQQ